jgi:hypothetical protein
MTSFGSPDDAPERGRRAAATPKNDDARGRSAGEAAARRVGGRVGTDQNVRVSMFESTAVEPVRYAERSCHVHGKVCTNVPAGKLYVY